MQLISQKLPKNLATIYYHSNIIQQLCKCIYSMQPLVTLLNTDNEKMKAIQRNNKPKLI